MIIIIYDIFFRLHPNDLYKKMVIILNYLQNDECLMFEYKPFSRKI